MAVTKIQKETIMKTFKTSELDTGSSEVQIALLTSRITEMSQHFAIHKKDVHGVRGLMRAVGRRRKLLDYLKRTNTKSYEKILKDLELRK
jgi:small subunit ribosomal protein S15